MDGAATSVAHATTVTACLIIPGTPSLRQEAIRVNQRAPHVPSHHPTTHMSARIGQVSQLTGPQSVSDRHPETD
jgi:hypothetical protein